MDDIEIDGQFYRVGTLSAFEQFHVSRRLAPLLSALGMAELESMTKPGVNIAMLALGPMSEALAAMSNADADYVMHTCLKVCSRKQGDGYARVMPTVGRLQFEDINMAQMMQLIVATLKQNLADFFPAPLPT